MMQSLEASCEEGERALKKFKSTRTASSLSLLCPQDPSTSSVFHSPRATFYSSTDQESVISIKSEPDAVFDLFAELEKLYDEEESPHDVNYEFDDPEDEDCTNVTYSSLLLEKLVTRERLNTVIFNLYPGNKGYSLAFRLMSHTDPNYKDIGETANMTETNLRPYEEEDLLRYIDKEELPPFIIEILDQFTYLFYSGCIIAEVRDYRQSYPQTKCDVHYVLLRPTQKSLLADINNLIEEKSELTNEDRDSLESDLLAAHTPDLFLDPDPHIENELAEINNRRYMWNTNKYRRIARKFSQVTVNRKRKLNLLTYRHGLEFYEFMNKAKTKPKIGTLPTARNIKKAPEEIKPVSVPNLDSPLLSPPPQPVVINEFKAFPAATETSDCLPQLIEEYVLETDMPSKDKSRPRVYHIKLSIFQRPINGEFLGELYLDRDYKKNEQHGVACRFSLGSRANANRYIHQFTEIFSESGRKQVRIRYGLSQGYRDRMAMAQVQVQQIQCQTSTQAQSQPNLARDHLNQLQTALQTQPTCSTTPIVNGALPQNINLVPQPHVVQSTQPTTSTLQPQVVTQKTATISSQEQEISALAMVLRNSAQQFQAAANAKQQAQQQQQHQQQIKFQTTNSHAAIINLLNSSPSTNINNDASAAMVNALNTNAALQSQRLVARKMTLSNVGGAIGTARVLNHNNLITLNNNRVSLNELSAQLAGQQAQTVTLATVNNYTVPVKQQVVQQRIIGSSNDGNKTLSALLVGTPAADRPEIGGTCSNSLLLEKLAGATPSVSQSTTAQFIQSPKTPQQFMVQSPKGNTVISPMSSPPPQAASTINVQSLNLGQQQGIGLQNFQVQLYPGFAQPISLLNVSSANLQGQPTSLLMSMPVTTVTQSSNSIAQGGISVSSNNIAGLGMGGQTVVLSNAGSHQLAQIVSSGVKGIQQPNLRPATLSGAQTVSLTQGGQQFQLISQLQRSRPAQTANASTSQLIQQPRNIQRTPVTIKMASPNNTNPAASQVTTLPLMSGQEVMLGAALPNQDLKSSFQDYQEVCRTNVTQPKNIAEFFENFRRNSNENQ